MRYDQTVTLLTLPKADPNSDDDYDPKPVEKVVKANVKRSNLQLASGEVYDTTVIRVYGQAEADKIKLPDGKTHKITAVGRHFRCTDFTIVNSEVIYDAK